MPGPCLQNLRSSRWSRKSPSRTHDAEAIFTEPAEFSTEEDVSFTSDDAGAVFTEPTEFSTEEDVSFTSDDAEAVFTEPAEFSTEEDVSFASDDAEAVFTEPAEFSTEEDVSFASDDAGAVFTEPAEFSTEEDVSFASDDAEAMFTEPAEFSTEEDVSFASGDAGIDFTEPQEFSADAGFAPVDEPKPGLKPEDFPLFDGGQNADEEAFWDDSSADVQQEETSDEDTLLDTLELDASQAKLQGLDESPDFSADDDESAAAVNFVADDENRWDGETDWDIDSQPDATDEFINEITDDGEEPTSTSVNLTEEDLDKLDDSGKGSGGSSTNWLVGLGLGVVCLGLLGILFNAFLGNRQTTEPVTEQPVEMPVPAEEETETPDAEDPTPEPEAPVAEEPEPEPEVPAEADYFREAVNAAQNAANLAQTASTGAEWQAVADSWNRAIELMKQVPEADPDYATAQQKAVDYQPNLDYAQQNAERL
jgi:hypothetical protein